ncbi:hypothetical protein DPMN_094876 [Dreissena polymorpha]|uniref:Uncharacterized protein n=1 Tax=Dreissena polymorpha TaxID=45954 RepID=A0A9D4L6I3_DREPO|nr:hypothetical protein DPMN_094876 [Dreissena polymorpha]
MVVSLGEWIACQTLLCIFNNNGDIGVTIDVDFLLDIQSVFFCRVLIFTHFTVGNSTLEMRIL